jgi:hypothetical protein
MPSEKDISGTITCIIDYLIKNSTLGNGLLAEKIDIDESKIICNNHNASELGDYAQYIAFSGILLNKKEYIDYAIKQVNLIVEIFQRTDGIFDLKPSKKLLYINDMDLYIGLVQMFMITKNEVIKNAIDKFYDCLFENILKNRTLIPAQLTKNLKLVVPISNPMDNGNHIELLGELYEFTGEEKYKTWMFQLSGTWLNNKNFYNYSLFERENTGLFGTALSSMTDSLFRTEFFRKRLGKPTYCVKITKQNTHLMFGLLKYYSISKNPRVKEMFNLWIQRIDQLFLHSSGIHYGIYDLKHKFAYRLEVLHTISLIELMLEGHKVFNEIAFLYRAENYAKALTDNLSDDHLILLFPFPEDDLRDPQKNQIQNEYNYYSLDPQIDLSVNLIRLYLITKREDYFMLAQKILDSILINFRYGTCFTEMVQHDTRMKWNIVRTKYLGLMLKPFLILLALQKGYSYEDMELRIISQDR